LENPKSNRSPAVSCRCTKQLSLRLHVGRDVYLFPSSDVNNDEIEHSSHRL